MPSGAVEDEDGVDIVVEGSGEAVEEQLHDGGADTGEHEGEVLAGGRSDRGEDVGPLVAVLAQARRTLALEPPAMTDPPLVADASLILEPELQAFARIGLGRGAQCGAEPLFLKRSCALASLSGWCGRAFCRENPMRRSTSLMLEG